LPRCWHLCWQSFLSVKGVIFMPVTTPQAEDPETKSLRASVEVAAGWGTILIKPCKRRSNIVHEEGAHFFCLLSMMKMSSRGKASVAVEKKGSWRFRPPSCCPLAAADVVPQGSYSIFQDTLSNSFVEPKGAPSFSSGIAWLELLLMYLLFIVLLTVPLWQRW